MILSQNFNGNFQTKFLMIFVFLIMLCGFSIIRIFFFLGFSNNPESVRCWNFQGGLNPKQDVVIPVNFGSQFCPGSKWTLQPLKRLIYLLPKNGFVSWFRFHVQKFMFWKNGRNFDWLSPDPSANFLRISFFSWFW